MGKEALKEIICIRLGGRIAWVWLKQQNYQADWK